MLAYNISAGVMTLPRVFAAMGLIPGILLINVVGSLAGLTAHTQWRAIMRYEHVNTYPDVLALMADRPGRWIGHISMNLIYLFIASIHILLSVQQWNAITGHGTCALAFSVLSSFLGFCFTLVRTLKEGTVLAVAAVISIFGAVIVTMIGVGIFGPDQPVHYLFIPSNLASLWDVSAGTSSTVFTFTGHIAYPQLIGEMENPEDFPKALLMNQIIMTIVYQTVGSVLYWKGGKDIASPALDSAPGTWSKIAWGIAWFTIQIAATIPMNLLAHNVADGMRLFQLGRQARQRLATSLAPPPWKLWAPITVGLWALAWLVAEGIPVFESLVALVGAALGSWITLGNGGLLHFRIEPDEPQGASDLGDAANRVEHGLPAVGHGHALNDGTDAAVPDAGFVTAIRNFARQAVVNARRSPWMANLNASIVLICVAICILGTGGSVVDIIDGAERRRPFSCGNGR